MNTITNFGQGILPAIKHQNPNEDQYHILPVKDCYLKQSENDAPWMAGDRARNKDGKLRQLRSDIKLTTLMKKYRDVAHILQLIPTGSNISDVVLGDLRKQFGAVGIKDILDKIRNGQVIK